MFFTIFDIGKDYILAIFDEVGVKMLLLAVGIFSRYLFLLDTEGELKALLIGDLTNYLVCSSRFF
jgi:hypothetical protein